MPILALSFVQNFFSIMMLAILAGVVGYAYFYVQGRRKRKNLERAGEMVYLRVTVAQKQLQEDHDTNFKDVVGRAEQMYSGLHGLLQNGLKGFLEGQEFFGLEIAGFNSPKEGEGHEINFYLIIPRRLVDFASKQITAIYSGAALDEVDGSGIFGEKTEQVGANIRLKNSYCLPLKTYKELDGDPLNELTNVFSGLGDNEGAAVQFMLRPVTNRWMAASHEKSKKLRAGKGLNNNAVLSIVNETLTLANSKPNQNPALPPPVSQIDEDRARAIDDKTRKLGFEMVIRVVASAPDKFRAEAELQDVLSAFTQFEDPTMNGFSGNYKDQNSVHIVRSYLSRNIEGTTKPFILNTQELASLFHLPDSRFNQTPGIKWQNFKSAPAPANIPTKGLLLGNNVFRGKETKIYLGEKDRNRHLYIIGKSGTGKSNFIQNLVLQDIQNGKGLCLVDPHGDLVENVLTKIPKDRAKDIIIFNPDDTERPCGMNLLEAKTPSAKEFAANETLSIFLKIFGDEIFGPRIQHYFRNAALTLMEDEDETATLIDIPRIFTDEKFRKVKIAKVRNPVVRAFWEQEFASTGTREKEEMIPFFSSKFGPFITSSAIRNIIGQGQSSFNFRKVMDEGKILLVNLSKGKIGEINMQLLGLIIVSKLQIAAMSRADMTEEERRDFYLYVDEFQNFATDSFASILSEARKYKLNLTIAHQFISQLKDEIRDAVFGNIGSMVAFKVGSDDAERLAKEFSPTFNEQDISNIANFKAYCKPSINNSPSKPFNISVPFDSASGDKKLSDAVKILSRLRYGRDKKFVEAETTARIVNV
ncbi:MAG: type IV secretion system DNA-binding domain-containing protein [Candidatus Gracilibacteria bacterium]|nr:type IV secretion system DNA-binding domain-containing protein [Candidatus Gracilibacteria bacterium]